MIDTKTIASNFTIQLAGKLLGVLVGLAAIAIISRSLGTEGWGNYTTAITFLQLFGVLVDFGLTLTLTVMISQDSEHEESIVGNFLGLRLVSGFFVFFLAPLIVLAFPWAESVKDGVLIGALAYFLMGGASMLIGVFQKHQAMWRAATAELLNRFVLVLVVGLFALTISNVVTMIFASVIANAVWLIAMIRFAKPFVHIRPQFDFSIWKSIIIKSWPIAVSIIFNLLYLKGDILFLASFRDETEVGLYGMAYRVIDLLTVLPTMFMGLMLPSLVQTWTAGNAVIFRAQVAKMFDLFLTFLIPVLFGIQLVGVPLVELIGGKEFAFSGRILHLLIFAMIGVVFGTLYGHLIVAINKQRVMMWGYAIVALVSIVGYFFFIPTYGVWGATAMTIFSEILIAIITGIVVYRTAKVPMRFTRSSRALVASLFMYVTLVVLPPFPVLLEIVCAAILFFGMMLLLGGIRKQELAELLRGTL